MNIAEQLKRAEKLTAFINSLNELAHNSGLDIDDIVGALALLLATQARDNANGISHEHLAGRSLLPTRKRFISIRSTRRPRRSKK